MILPNNRFKEEASKIDNSKQNPVYWIFNGLFIDEDLEHYDVINILQSVIISDYVNRPVDHRYVEVRLLRSVYSKLLQINRKGLKFQFYRRISTPLTNSKNTTNAVMEEYEAYLTDTTSDAVETKPGLTTGKHIDDSGSFVDITVQLISAKENEYRLCEDGGIQRNVTDIKKLLQNLMTRLGFTVTMRDPDNLTKSYQLTIPNGVRLPELPFYLQKVKGGVYSAGIACYQFNKSWYIFPPYAVEDYDKTEHRLTIINIPKNEMMGLTNSYVVVGNELSIYTTGDTSHFDNADRNMDKTGNGLKMAKGQHGVNNFTDTAKGETLAPKDRNYVAVNFDSRTGSSPNIKPVKGLVSTNIWDETSQIVKGMCNIIQVSWEAANPYLIYPGMPLKFLYRLNNDVYCLKGRVGKMVASSSTNSFSMKENRSVYQVELTLIVQRAVN